MLRLADSSESRYREARKARLSDPGLLDVFMATRRACLAEGRSVMEANARAHEAVDAAEQTRVSRPAPVMRPGGEPPSGTDGL